MNNFYSESLKNIFFTFGNEYRLKIIDALFMKRLTMTKLAVELDSEISTIQNYVEYLLQNEIIEKESKRKLQINQFYRIIDKTNSFVYIFNK